MAGLSFEGVSKVFPDGTHAVDRLDLEVDDGERPEAIAHVPNGVPEPHALEAPVVLVESLGSDLLVHTELDAPAILTRDQLEVAREVGGHSEAKLERARF